MYKAIGKRIVATVLLFSSLYADMNVDYGTGINKEKAISSSKSKILLKEHKNFLKTIPICATMTQDTIGFNEDDYNVVLLKISDIQYLESHVKLKAEFDIEVIEDDFIDKLTLACNEELQSREQKRKFDEFISRFHIGTGVSGWPPSYGIEMFAEYRNESDKFSKNFSIYLTGSYGTYQQDDEWGSVTLVGVQVRFINFLVLGYEHVLAIDSAKNTMKEANGALTWGFVYSPEFQSSRYEFGLIFKDLDSRDDKDHNGISGGFFVRYKFI